MVSAVLIAAKDGPVRAGTVRRLALPALIFLALALLPPLAALTAHNICSISPPAS